MIEKVAARRIQIVQDSAGMISGSDIDFKVDEYRQQLIQEAEKGGERNMMVLESEDSTIEDFQKYMDIISEASRTLKTDGKLIIAEKKQRIDLLVRILSNQSGKKFLHDNGLTLASVEANTQKYRSRYAEFAAMTSDIRSARGLEPQSGLEPFVLTFEKKGITLTDQPAP